MLELLLLAIVIGGAYAERKVLKLQLAKAELKLAASETRVETLVAAAKSAEEKTSKALEDRTRSVAAYARNVITKIVTEAKTEAGKAEATGASVIAKVEEIAKKF